MAEDEKEGTAPAEGSSARTPSTLNSNPTARTPSPAAAPAVEPVADADEIEGPLVQHEEVRAANLRTAPRGRATATGLAIAEESEAERVEGIENRGGNEDLIGEAPEHGDYLGEPNELSEAQQIPSGFAANGAVDERMVASPSGPQPVSTVARSREEAENRLVEQRRKELDSVRRKTSGFQKLTDQQIRAMGGAEARAVLADRGYVSTSDSASFSNRAAREALIKHQAEDPQFAEEEEE